MYSMLISFSLATAPVAPDFHWLGHAHHGCNGDQSRTICQGIPATAKTVTRTTTIKVETLTPQALALTPTAQAPPVVAVPANLPLPMTTQYGAPREERVRGLFHRLIDVHPLHAMCSGGNCGR